MTVYLASPGSQMHADHLVPHLEGMPVLLSYATWDPWLDSYQQAFSGILIDSGAFSVLSSGREIDVHAFADWSERWRGRADAVAGLDDIAGDWRRGLKNIEAMPDGLGFPTFHDTDPFEILPELIQIARERGNWIGIGMTPRERHLRAAWLSRVLDLIPNDIHVHGWAGRRYWATHGRLDSIDGTGWFRDALDLRTIRLLRHLTPAECVAIIVKRYIRERRVINPTPGQLGLFDTAVERGTEENDA